eukprot:TRINITY_DN104699_c0_g1_i1.p2 TRINITY_DN104699_c0_g1~~TRINITY_DN104699_c0_g1_i1.p2  ORF type:complete len:117 (-),score=26.33 TRINITY_DN104699_c0_g1_i1:88-438(-)
MGARVGRENCKCCQTVVQDDAADVKGVIQVHASDSMDIPETAEMHKLHGENNAAEAGENEPQHRHHLPLKSQIRPMVEDPTDQLPKPARQTIEDIGCHFRAYTRVEDYEDHSMKPY